MPSKLLLLGASGSMGTVAWYNAGGAPAPIAVYQPKGAASLAASYSNLINPGTYDAAPGTAPAWDTATGWQFNGSSQYLLTGITFASGWSMIVRLSNHSTTGYHCIVGAFNNDLLKRAYLCPSYDASNALYGAGGAALVSPVLTEGTMALAGQTAYRNGNSDGTVESGNGLPSRALFIGAQNADGEAAQFCPAYVQALAIYNATLTAPQVLAVHGAMVAL